MTSQFAVLNSLGVAIASDTVSSIVEDAGKILKTNQNVEKLFEIGPEHKVVVAISGDLELDSAPVSLLIGEWAASLTNPFQTLTEYRSEFCRWLDSNFKRFSDGPTEDLLARLVVMVYGELRSRAEQSFSSAEESNQSFEAYFEKELHEMIQELVGSDLFLNNFERVLTELDDYHEFVRQLSLEINEENLQLPSSVIDLFPELVQLCVIKSSALLDDFVTEIAFIGFGDYDLYAGSISFKAIGHIGDSLVQLGQREMMLDQASHSSAFIGFAQQDAVASLLLGISPDTRFGIFNFVIDYLSKFELSEEELEEFLLAYQEYGDQYAENNYQGPLLDSISSLSLSDLCSLARSLVGVQALRSSSGNAPASVGGFIESVVIDRRHGVRWSTRMKSI